MDKLVKAGIRLSRAEIVREGLKSIKYGLDHEFDELEAAKDHIRELREAEKDE